MRVEFFIALRYLLRRRKAGFVSLISLISVLGVAVGVMALIVVLSVMSGFDRELKAKIVGINPHVVITKHGGVAGYDELIHRIQALGLPKVHSVSAYVSGQGIIRSDTNAIGVMVKGVDCAHDDVTFLKDAIRQGSFFGTTTAEPAADADAVAGEVLLGESLARNLMVHDGDTVQIISPYLEKKGLFKTSARTMTFRVTGIFQCGMYDVDSTLVLLPLKQAQALYNLGDTVTGISIRLSDVYWAERIKAYLQKEIGYPYWVETWIDMNRNFFAALKVEKNVMAILLFLIIIVAAFNIVSTLIMVVMEKTKDIGILKALGVSRNAIKRIFILEGTIVGTIGTSVGVGLGLIIVRWLNPIADVIKTTTGFEVFPSDIYYFDKIPTETSMVDVTVIACIAFVLTVCAGMYPAARAASLNPAEALRYE